MDLGTLLGSAALFGVIQWLLSWWLKTRLEESIRSEYAVILERTRADLALSTEIAKRRGEAVAEIFARLVRYEAQWRDVALKFTDAYLTTMEQYLPGEVPQWRNKDLEGRFDIIAPLDSRFSAPLDIGADPAPFNALLAERRSLKEQIATSAFWLGPAIEHDLQDWLNDLDGAMHELVPAPEYRARAKEILRRLRGKRPYATMILRRLEEEGRAGSVSTAS